MNPEPAIDTIQLKESNIISLNNSVWPVDQASILYQHRLSTLCLNKNRAAIIIYYHVSVPLGIDLDHCSTHPAITEIEKQYQCNGGLNPQPCPWDLNLVIEWHTSNHSWAKLVNIKVKLILVTIPYSTLLLSRSLH